MNSNKHFFTVDTIYRCPICNKTFSGYAEATACVDSHPNMHNPIIQAFEWNEHRNAPETILLDVDGRLIEYGYIKEEERHAED